MSRAPPARVDFPLHASKGSSETAAIGPIVVEEYDDGVPGDISAFQQVDESTDIFIHVFDHGENAGDVIP